MIIITTFRLLKYVTFWFLLIALFVCLFNLTGYDDKDILLYFSNPAGWIWPLKPNFLAIVFNSEWMRIAFIYCYMLLFWGISGLVLDSIIYVSKRKKLLKWLASIVIIASIFICVINITYKTKSNESGIVHILKYSEQYSNETVQAAISRALADGYAIKHVDEINSIIHSSTDEGTINNALYALASIGTPEAIMALQDADYNPKDITTYLQMNSRTIVSMLELNQPPDVMEAGIKATTLYRINVFINKLNRIIEEHPDDELVKQARDAVLLIEQHPHK